jgi:thiamine-monophosphate kinase
LRAGAPDRTVLVGPGDDAAAVRAGRRPLLFTTDSLIEGIHFRRGWDSPAGLGRRAFAVNASDVAAMGGVPRYALLALEVPGGTPVAEIDALVAGFAGAARRSGARLIGGNVAGGPHLAITVALIGEAPGRVITRGGARRGDVLFVTGHLGATGIAVRALTAGRRVRLPAAPLRVQAGVLLASVAHAMVDVSDGLAQDVAHVCRASRVGATIELAKLPVAPACRRVLGGRAALFAASAGEDYELAIAVPRRRLAALARLRLPCRLTEVGRVTGGAGVRLLDRTGRTVRPPRTGFDHFRRR